MTHNPSYLVLEARFIAGSYGGTEWPPAPFRLLQAMVAGLRTINHPALRWFEAQPAPLILAQSEPPPVQFRRSVPNNANPSKQQSLTTLRDVIRRQVQQPVWYCYAIPAQTSAETIASALEAAYAVHTLGVGEDMCVVEGRVSISRPESKNGITLWQPTGAPTLVSQTGEVRLNVPVAGSLTSLEERFQAFQQRLDQQAHGYGRPVLPPARHGVVAYRSSDDAPRWAVVPLTLCQPGQTNKPARFHAERTVVVAGMLRHACMQLAGNGLLADFAAGYGSPEDKDSRLSWIPLPSVGHAYVDGMVRRALLMSRLVDAEKLEALLGSGLADGLSLVDEQTGECVAIAEPADGRDDAVFQQYFRSSRTWCTVTPMVMPGDYAESQRLLNRLLIKSLKESGLDPSLLVRAEFSKQGFMPQAVRIRDLKLKDWKAKRLEVQHVRLHFSKPIRGPMVLGRGRHYGIGLFCANSE
jgi:CRISPR-associated protein Csb2